MGDVEPDDKGGEGGHDSSRLRWWWLAAPGVLDVASGMGAFGVLLVIMVGEIMSRSRPWGAVAVELAGVAVFTGLLVWIAWTWRIGQRAEATWPLVVMGVVAVAIAVFTPGEGLLVGTVAALGGLYLAPRLAVGVIVAAAGVVLVSSLFDADRGPARSALLPVGFLRRPATVSDHVPPNRLVERPGGPRHCRSGGCLRTA